MNYRRDVEKVDDLEIKSENQGHAGEVRRALSYSDVASVSILKPTEFERSRHAFSRGSKLHGTWYRDIDIPPTQVESDVHSALDQSSALHVRSLNRQ
jgi:hypothetical protein